MEARDIDTMFREAVQSGPVLILANMSRPDHSATIDPITENSPLVRMAIVAANLGATSFTFAADGPIAYRAAVYAYQPHDTAAMQALAGRGVPAMGVHWCGLNAWAEAMEYAHGGEYVEVRVKSEKRPNTIGITVDYRDHAQIDYANPAHVRAMEAVEGWFHVNGWDTAAQRIRNVLDNPPEQTERWGPIDCDPPKTAAEALVELESDAA